MTRRFDYLAILILTALIGFMAYFMTGCNGAYKRAYKQDLINIKTKITKIKDEPNFKHYYSLSELEYYLELRLRRLQ